jgi:hypothetical protein
VISLSLRKAPEAVMFAWGRKAGKAQARVESDAAALMGSGGDPYRAARAKERAAANDDEARHWSRIAIELDKRTGRRVGLDTATRMGLEMDAVDGAAALPRTST